MTSPARASRPTLPAAALAGFLALPASPAPAGVLLRVPDQYPTIGSALAAAQAGDTVAVRAGAYAESFVPLDGVAVLGGYAPGFVNRDPELHVTTLASAGRVVFCDGCAGYTAVIDGFTMTGGNGADDGGIVSVRNASPTLSHNRFLLGRGRQGGGVQLVSSSSALRGNLFTGCSSSGVGGALAVFGSAATIQDCRFESNRSLASGGAAFLDNSSSTIFSRCVFADNDAGSGGAILIQNSWALVDSCVMVRNSCSEGGAVAVFGSRDPTLANCTLYANRASLGGGVYVGPAARASIVRSIVTANSGGGLAVSYGAVLWNGCNDVWANFPWNYSSTITPGAGSFSLDPIFCDSTSGDWTISDLSPCAPLNAPGCGLIGALPVACVHRFIRVPDDVPTVTEALAIAAPRDTVAVAEGHYVERLSLGSGVALLGGWRSDFAGRDPLVHPTVIDAGGSGSAVVAESGAGPATVIDGFVITGGNNPGGFGGGIDCLNASPTIRQNVFRENRAGQGAAIGCRAGTEPRIEGNVLTGNVALAAPGGAIYMESADVRECWIEHNTLDGNQGPSASGIVARVGANAVIRRNIVVNGIGVGIFADGGAGPVTGCNDVWNNSGGDYSGVLPGPNTLSLDPLFCPGPERLLRDDSPCAPGQAPAACGLIGAREVGCIAAAIPPNPAVVPLHDWLGASVPNPMNPDTELAFGLAHAARIRLAVLDLAGRHVRTLLEETRTAGEHRARWDGRSDSGQRVPSGVYLYRLTADGRPAGQRKVLVLR